MTQEFKPHSMTLLALKGHLVGHACITSSALSFAPKYFDTLSSAFTYADTHRDVWKISFTVPTGERVRLVRDAITNDWVYAEVLL